MAGAIVTSPFDVVKVSIYFAGWRDMCPYYWHTSTPSAPGDPCVAITQATIG